MSDEANENNHAAPIPELSNLAPEAGSDYWADIDARLEAAADTGAEAIRLDAMDDTTISLTPISNAVVEGENRGNRLVLAVAAAVILAVAGVGFLTLLGPEDTTPTDTASGSEPAGAETEIERPPASADVRPEASPEGFWTVGSVVLEEMAFEFSPDTRLLSAAGEVVIVEDGCTGWLGETSWEADGRVSYDLEVLADWECEPVGSGSDQLIEALAQTTTWELAPGQTLVLTGPASRVELSQTFGSDEVTQEGLEALVAGDFPLPEEPSVEITDGPPPDNVPVELPPPPGESFPASAGGDWFIIPGELGEGECSLNGRLAYVIDGKIVSDYPELSTVTGGVQFFPGPDGQDAFVVNCEESVERVFLSRSLDLTNSVSPEVVEIPLFGPDIETFFNFSDDWAWRDGVFTAARTTANGFEALTTFSSSERRFAEGQEIIEEAPDETAEQARTFITPSGNTECVFGFEEFVSCWITEKTWEIRAQDIPLEQRGDELVPCEFDFGNSVWLAQGGQPQFGCDSDLWWWEFDDDGNRIEPGVLPYGESVSRGTISCLSERTGLTCADSSSGGTFTMGRDLYPFDTDDTQN